MCVTLRRGAVIGNRKRTTIQAGSDGRAPAPTPTPALSPTTPPTRAGAITTSCPPRPRTCLGTEPRWPHPGSLQVRWKRSQYCLWREEHAGVDRKWIQKNEEWVEHEVGTLMCVYPSAGCCKCCYNLAKKAFPRTGTVPPSC